MTDRNFDFGNRLCVVKALTGSHNYNLNTPTSDKDFKFFVTPTFEDLYHGHFFATGNHSDSVDYTVYDVRKLGALVFKANISFIEVLFSVEEAHDPDLDFLFAERERWGAMNLPAFYKATIGMHFEKMKTLHKGTEKSQVLVDKFGYDTKDACHALRCLYVVQRYWNTESMAKALWFPKGEMRTTLLNVKAGKFSED